MKIRFKQLLLALMGVGATFQVVQAQNPIFQTSFTPDPAPLVYNDTLFLFVGHDEEDAEYFKMKDWQLFSTTDMVNWSYRGAPISTQTFPWAKQGDNAWAAQAIERNGKFYWYICAEDLTTPHLHGIGVAVSDSPTGPYTDPLQRPLVPGAFGFIDPTVFIDEDGQAYLFWGNNGLWYAKLNEDMISLANEVIQVDLNDESAFGPLVMKRDYQDNQQKLKTNFEEGAWVFKRKGIYYNVYAAGGVPEHMAYSTARQIEGPWEYGGRIMDESPNSFTIHGGSVEFKGRNFMFYHNGLLPNGGGFKRSTCVEEFAFNADGSIPFIPFTKEGVVTPIHYLDPYKRVEAETMAWSVGLKTATSPQGAHYLTSIHAGDYLKLRSVDLGSKGCRSFQASVATLAQGGAIELRLDSPTGEVIATLPIPGGGTGDKWQLFTAQTASVTGLHDIYLLFKGGDGELFHFDYWSLEE
ncbi:MAG: glycoside hydrolase family 43 protein [Phocaeicola sp.]